MNGTPTLRTVKTLHTGIWLVVELAMAYLLYSGVRKRSDRRAAIAGGIVASETLVFLGNGCRCPLTDLAESLGSEHGSVTDLYLPRWLARSLPAIHVPLLALAILFHGRNVRSLRSRKLVPSSIAELADTP